MRSLLIASALASAAVLVHAAPDTIRLIPAGGEAAKYWTRWRGPSGQGLVDGTNYTDAWSPTTRVKWRTPIAGLGHSSPIVWNDLIFLTTASFDGSRVSLLAFRRADGAKVWETPLPTTGVEHVYDKNSRASATPTTDGERIYVSFGTHGLAAFDFAGRIVWHRQLGQVLNYHGTAGSPVLYKSQGAAAPDRIFLYQDHDGSPSLRSFVAAFDTRTGKTIWWKDRTETVGWGTPVVIQAGDRDELIISSQRRIYGYNPDTGDELWQVRGNMSEVIPTPVVGHGFVFCSSGRAGPTFAIRPGGKGDVTATHVAWTSPRGSPFVPSGLVHGDYLYLINDMQSILTVFDAKTGKLAYQDRLGEPVREGFSSSPVAVGNKIFLTNDDGRTFVVEAGPVFKLLRVNEMGARVIASPALVGGVWYWRTDRDLLAIE
jgi:outer membrane protein assembly factor BamB